MPLLNPMARALRTYFKPCNRGLTSDQPSASASGVETIDDQQYAVLRNGRGVLAVFRFTRTGRLRRVSPEAWPAPLRTA